LLQAVAHRVVDMAILLAAGVVGEGEAIQVVVSVVDGAGPKWLVCQYPKGIQESRR
jgi:hypothetical protein